jgi:hypothetical protein
MKKTVSIKKNKEIGKIIFFFKKKNIVDLYNNLKIDIFTKII